jgi:hypothetical protein
MRHPQQYTRFGIFALEVVSFAGGVVVTTGRPCFVFNVVVEEPDTTTLSPFVPTMPSPSLRSSSSPAAAARAQQQQHAAAAPTRTLMGRRGRRIDDDDALDMDEDGHEDGHDDVGAAAAAAERRRIFRGYDSNREYNTRGPIKGRARTASAALRRTTTRTPPWCFAMCVGK